MPDYRRFYLPNSPVFITCVTAERKRILQSKVELDLYWGAVRRTQKKLPFELMAYAILPDHFHWLIMMPEEQPNFSLVLQKMKWIFALDYKQAQGLEGAIKIWQRGFWDHVIRDEKDLGIHLDYIHWNPVKHGYVKNPEDWEQSSLLEWVSKGYYESGWGEGKDIEKIEGLEFE